MASTRISPAIMRMIPLLKNINDPYLKNIIVQILEIEAKNRSIQVPRQKIKDVIDSEARLQEREEGVE